MKVDKCTAGTAPRTELYAFKIKSKDTAHYVTNEIARAIACLPVSRSDP